MGWRNHGKQQYLALLCMGSLRLMVALFVALAVLGCQGRHEFPIQTEGQKGVQELPIPTALAHLDPYDIGISLGGEWLAIPGGSGSAHLLNTVTGLYTTFKPVMDSRQEARIAFSKSGQLLAVANPEEGITIWDVISKKSISKIILDSKFIIYSLIFLDGDRTLQAIALRKQNDWDVPRDHSAIRWETATGKPLVTEQLGRHPLLLAITPEGRHAIILENGIEKVRDLKVGENVFEGNQQIKWSMFTPNGSNLLTCDGKSISFWDVPSFNERRRVAVFPPIQYIGMSWESLAISTDGMRLAVAGHPKRDQAAVINLDTGKIVAIVNSNPASLGCRIVRLSPDGKHLVTGTGCVDYRDKPTQPYLKFWMIPNSE